MIGFDAGAEKCIRDAARLPVKPAPLRILPVFGLAVSS